MKEITILSGKGGTGKTSITAAIASLAKNAVFCDNDVDAADLHLLLQPTVLEKHVFQGGWIASIQQESCTNCGICAENCRFDAISFSEKNGYKINPFLCEGCRLCERVCPVSAIKSEKSSNNFWYVSDTRFGTMVHAHLGPGEENSGKLVSLIRKKAQETARASKADFIINDGPPGIGCPAIASLTGTDAVLVVTEPSKSGWHDASRLIELVEKFGIPVFAVINKFDINISVSDDIENILKKKGIPMLAKIPFSETMVKALIQKKTIHELTPKSKISYLIRHIWEKIKN